MSTSSINRSRSTSRLSIEGDSVRIHRVDHPVAKISSTQINPQTWTQVDKFMELESLSAKHHNPGPLIDRASREQVIPLQLFFLDHKREFWIALRVAQGAHLPGEEHDDSLSALLGVWCLSVCGWLHRRVTESEQLLHSESNSDRGRTVALEG